MKTIVLGRVEMTGLRETGRLVRFDGYNYKPEIERIPEAKAMVWLNSGDMDDVQKAKTYAQENGYNVFLFPTDEPDPLALANSKLVKTP